jgi:hypothetical protein
MFEINSLIPLTVLKEVVTIVTETESDISETSPMTIHEKLRRLTKFSSLQAVSKASGFSPSTLRALLLRESNISTSMASSLADVLEVDRGWLMDDRRGWPPMWSNTPQAAELHTAPAA